MTYFSSKQNFASPTNFKYQSGWTMWSMMFVMTVLFIAAYIGMQLVPIFSTNSTIESAMRGSLDNKDLRTITRKSIVNSMQKQLYIDGANKVLNYKNDLKVERLKNKFVVQANYEREVPLLSNMALVVRLNPRVECELNGRCDP